MSEQGLLIQRCERCDHHWFPERIACAQCGSAALVPEPAGVGVVADRVEVLRAPSDAGDGPVIIALVVLEAGPRVLARARPDTAIDDRVELVDVGGAVHLRPTR